jgi:hypothetical protein
MKNQNEIGEWYKAANETTIVHVYLYFLSSYSEVWKWEIEFTKSEKTISDTTGWAPSLDKAKKAAREHAELFVGKGNVGKFYKQSAPFPLDEDVV